MAFLISTIQGMENKINDFLLNQKILGRIVKTKFHDLNIKVTQMTTTVNQLKKEVDALLAPSSSYDDDSPLQTHTQFSTHGRSSSMLVPESRPSSTAPISALVAPSAPPMSTPTPNRT
ncbi:hypothetical protein D1007_17004 [Hordeum vulgare]|nr:hypothetical protein D1007_17004 [Hordeum vulgare]